MRAWVRCARSFPSQKPHGGLMSVRLTHAPCRRPEIGFVLFSDVHTQLEAALGAQNPIAAQHEVENAGQQEEEAEDESDDQTASLDALRPALIATIRIR